MSDPARTEERRGSLLAASLLVLTLGCGGSAGAPAALGPGPELEAALALLDAGRRGEGLDRVVAALEGRAAAGGDAEPLEADALLRLQRHLIPLAPEEADPRILVRCTLLLSRVLGREGLMRAREPLARELEREPASFAALYALGYLAKTFDFAEQTAAYLTRAAEARPDRVEGHFALAALAAEQGRWTEARRLYERVLELDGDHHAARYRRARILYREDGDAEAALAEARIVAERAERRDAASAETLVAEIAGRRGDLETALRSFRRAVEAVPESGAYQYNLGTYLFDLGRVSEAAEHLRRAIELRPGDARPHFFLGLIAEDDDRLAEAVRQYRAALAKDPGHGQARYRVDLVQRRLERAPVAEGSGREP